MNEHEKWVTGWFVFSCLSQALPEPLPTDRWYGFVYRFVHLIGLNFRLLSATANETRMQILEEKKDAESK